MLRYFKRSFPMAMLIFASHSQAMSVSKVLLNSFKKNTKYNLLTLKNGTLMRPKDIWATMSSLITLATSDDKAMKDAHTLIAVLQNVFFNKEIEQVFIDKLKHLSLIDASKKPTKNTIDIVTSSLENPKLLDKKDPALSKSILRSPIKGRFLDTPLLITSSNYNNNAYYSINYAPKQNKLAIYNRNPRFAFPEIYTYPLRLESEKKQDILPYFFPKGRFADPCDLQPIEEFIDEIEKHEYFQDIAQRILDKASNKS